MTPKVSVVLCCYNQKAYVRDAIESVLNQTYPNMELVLIDNGSTDGSLEIYSDYEKDARVKLLLRTTNEPVTKRFNEAIAASTGDFISILYSDDYYLPTKIEIQMACFSKLSAQFGVVYSPGYRLNVVTKEQFVERSMMESGSILRSMLVDYHRKGFINPVSPLVRRECFLKYPFREGVFLEGEGIYFRIAMTYHFKYLDEPIVVMRDHPHNIGKAIKKTKEVESFLVQKLLLEPEFPKQLRTQLKNYYARVLRNYGWQCIRMAKDNAWARACFIETLRWDLRQALHPRLLAGFLFSLLPSRLMDKLNGIANNLNNEKRLLGFRESYQ